MKKIKIGDRTFKFPWSADIRPLTLDEKSRLWAALDEEGIQVPILHDADDNVLDGFHRLEWAAEHGIGFRLVPLKQVSSHLTKQEKRDMASRVNAARRQMTAEEIEANAERRRHKVVELREEGHSLRAIAEEVEVSESTVRNDLAASGAQGCAPETVTGQDGKEYPATKPAENGQPKQCPSCTRKARVGQSLPRSCADCKKLNADRQPGEDDQGISGQRKAPKAGSTVFTLREFKEHTGKCRYLLDKLAHEHGLEQEPSRKGMAATVIVTPEHQAILDLIGQVEAQTAEWQKTLKAAKK